MTAKPSLIADGQSIAVRKLLLLTSAVVFFDTLFFSALTPLLPHFADELGARQDGRRRPRGRVPRGSVPRRDPERHRRRPVRA